MFYFIIYEFIHNHIPHITLMFIVMYALLNFKKNTIRIMGNYFDLSTVDLMFIKAYFFYFCIFKIKSFNQP